MTRILKLSIVFLILGALLFDVRAESNPSASAGVTSSENLGKSSRDVGNNPQQQQRSKRWGWGWRRPWGFGGMGMYRPWGWGGMGMGMYRPWGFGYPFGGMGMMGMGFPWFG